MEIFNIKTLPHVFSSDIVYTLDVEWDVQVLDIKKINHVYEIKTLSTNQVHTLLSFSEIYGCHGVWKIKKMRYGN